MISIYLVLAVFLATAYSQSNIVINDGAGLDKAIELGTNFTSVVRFNAICSGTIISDNCVITAKHCTGNPSYIVQFHTDNDANPEHTATTSSVVTATGSADLSGNDVAILVVDVPPEYKKIKMMLGTPTPDSQVAINFWGVGFGRSGVGSTGDTIGVTDHRRAYRNIVDYYGKAASSGGPIGNTANIYSSDFDNGQSSGNTLASVGSSAEPFEFEGTTAGGDSGGPVLDLDTGFIWAVLYGGTGGNVYGDIMWHTGLEQHRTLIEATCPGAVFAHTRADMKVNVNDGSTAVTTVPGTASQTAPFTFDIVGGFDKAAFSLTGASLAFVNAPNFGTPTDSNTDNVYEVEVRVVDANGRVAVQFIEVTVTNAPPNQAPIISSSATNTVGEGTTDAISVVASDPDGDTLTYAINGGDDSALFAISSSGQVTFKSAPVFAAPTDANSDNVYEFNVEVNDGNGGSASQNIMITVVSNKPPVIFVADALAVPSFQTYVTSVQASDDSGEPVTFAISGGVDAGSLAINSATGALYFTSAPITFFPRDDDKDNVYEIQIEATDNEGAKTTKDISITVQPYSFSF